ncbi:MULTISPECIES: hypothetical protein [Wolbachia]|jgi:rRNA-processing protein FCF1|uniref:Uncharacterized protein n=3 Tax=Wolbachia TaxID=953 RepID=A0A6I6CV77_WOLPI|nr:MULTISPECIES: hypothetical protein [Wolbachia]MDE5062947.1 hypothetical protein [Wolbachia endosymbiont of Drosophila chauvacae]MDU8940643.1 hypothetical protein [Wolbachia endosymbiont of Drosophila malagassya]CDR79141.1 hypothetical protein WPAU_0766 [Wolbachia endosymbiont of Drosophila simulans wAu]BEP31746.1 MAG: hypothetical protein WBIAU1_12240 [Wolbachia endosymbiont of Drosophila biauraria]AOV87554.1 hypothetical protein WG67_03315 [Wolbachia endosymbiont of Drosophila incompta]
MSKLPNNAKIGKSQVTQWEVIKNCEYADNCLSKIVTLYVIRITQLSDFYTSDEPEINTVLARISVTSENVFLNKATTIEVMEGIFPYKFNSKKRNNVLRLEDLYNYLCSIVNNSLPKEMLESLVREYKDAVNLFKAIT